MRVAVCISGQVRTAAHTAGRILQFLKGVRADIFIHTWDEDTTLPYCIDKGVVSNTYSTPTKIDRGVFDFIKEIYNPISMKIDNIKEYEVRNHTDLIARHGKPPVMLIGMFNSMYEANLLKKHYETTHNFRYDYVLKLRFDVVYGTDETLTDQMHFASARRSDNIIYTKDFMNKLPEAVEDISLFGSSVAMDIASDFVRYRETDEEKVKIDWQHVYADYLKNLGIEVRPWMNNSVYIYRKEHIQNDILPSMIRKIK